MNYLSEWPQLYHTELLMTLCQKSERVVTWVFLYFWEGKGISIWEWARRQTGGSWENKNCFYKVLWKMKKKLSEQRIIVAYGKYPQRAWRTWLCGGHYLKALSFSPVRFICPKTEIQRKQVALALLFVDLGQNSKSTERMMELSTQTWRNW